MSDAVQMAFQTGKVGGPLGMQLEGKTLGIIGMGAIGASLPSSPVWFLWLKCST